MIGYMLVGVSALLWIAASILDRLHIAERRIVLPRHGACTGSGVHHIGPGGSGGHHEHCNTSDCPFWEPATTSPIVAATSLAPSRCYVYVRPAPTGRAQFWWREHHQRTAQASQQMRYHHQIMRKAMHDDATRPLLQRGVARGMRCVASSSERSSWTRYSQRQGVWPIDCSTAARASISGRS